MSNKDPQFGVNPVYAPAEVLKFHKSCQRYKELELNWWMKDKNIPFYHPYLMISSYYSLLVKEYNIREIYKIPKDIFIFGDSGGAQIASGVEKWLSPERVLRWLEKDCNVGFTLDYPTHSSDTFSQFKEKAKKTAENNKFYEQERNIDNGLLIYNVIHGESKSRLDYWWNMMKDFQFEGYGIAIHPNVPTMYAMGVMYLYDKGVTKNIHALGCSGFDAIPVLIYLSKFVKNLSFDSSSYSEGRVYRNYRMPFDVKIKKRFGDSYNGKPIDIKACWCPICQKLDSCEILNGPGSEPGMLQALHNLFFYIKYIQLFNGIKNDKEFFDEVVRKNCGENTKLAIKFIDTCIDKGFDYASRVYDKSLWKIQKHSVRTFNLVGDKL